MNKQNLWFFTLFSIILILGVYYITLPTEFLQEVNLIEKKNENKKEEVKVKEIIEENSLTALRVNKEDEREDTKQTLEQKLTNSSLTTDEKNNVYEELKYLNEVQGLEEQLEKKIKKDYNLDCFIRIEKQDVTVICISKEHNKEQANNIMRLIQNEYKEKKNISVKFQKK